MATAVPIVLTQVFQLKAAGIPADAISFLRITIDSAGCVVVRRDEHAGGNLPTSTVTIVDVAAAAEEMAGGATEARNSTQTLPVTADGAIMHPHFPSVKLLALRAGTELQAFDLDTKSLVCRASLEGDECVFWRWLDANTIVLVGRQYVYFWEPHNRADQPASTPRRIFFRSEPSGTEQVVGFRASAKADWLCVQSLSVVNGQIAGRLHLYSTEKQASQHIDGAAGTFCSYTPPGTDEALNVFTFCRFDQEKWEVMAIHVGGTSMRKIHPLPARPDDIPVILEFSPAQDMLFLLTKQGHLMVMHMEEGFLFDARISTQTIFLSTVHPETGAVIGIARGGEILSISLNTPRLAAYLRNTMDKGDVATRLGERYNLDDPDGLRAKELFYIQFDAGNYSAAAKIAARSPKGILRTPETLAIFLSLPESAAGASGTHPALTYISVLAQNDHVLTIEEAHHGVRLACAAQRIDRIEEWLRSGRLRETDDETKELLRTHVKSRDGASDEAEAQQVGSGQILECFVIAD